MNQHLYRSRDERVIAGVAGGLAERMDLDPALLVYIVMAIVVPDDDRAWMPYTGSAPWTGAPPAPDGTDPATAPTTATPTPGLPGATTTPSWAATGAGTGPAYGPPTMDRYSWRAQRRAERAARRAGRRSGSGALIAGGALIILGALFLVREYVPDFDADRIWPLFLIGIGVVFLLAAFSRYTAGPGADVR